MKKLLLLLIIPFLSFGQNQECEYQELEGFSYGGYFQGSHYYISEGTSTWMQANDNINLLGIGHFVSITSEEENDFIVETFSESTPCVWIGLYQNCPDNGIDINTGACLNSNSNIYNAEEIEIWEWLSGEPLVYQNWQEGCPACGSNEDIALIYTIDYAGTPSGEWNDGLINGGNPYASILEVECDTQTNAEAEENDNTNTGAGDNNGDGVVNLQDLFAVLDNWLETYTYSDNMTENQINATLDSVISIISTLLPEGTNIGDMLVWNGDNWGLIEAGNNGDMLTISDDGLPVWNNSSVTILDLEYGETSDCNYINNLNYGSIIHNPLSGISSIVVPGVQCGSTEINLIESNQWNYTLPAADYLLCFSVNDSIVMTSVPGQSNLYFLENFMEGYNPNMDSSENNDQFNSGQVNLLLSSTGLLEVVLVPNKIYGWRLNVAGNNVVNASQGINIIDPEIFNHLGIWEHDGINWQESPYFPLFSDFYYYPVGKSLKNL